MPPKELRGAYWNDIGAEDVASTIVKFNSLNTNKAKNVILFIGDGMSLASVVAGRIHKAQKENQKAPGEESFSSLDVMPHSGIMKTYSGRYLRKLHMLVLSTARIEFRVAQNPAVNLIDWLVDAKLVFSVTFVSCHGFFYTVSHQTPDSAATATAFLCGIKTKSTMLGVSGQASARHCGQAQRYAAASVLENAIAVGKISSKTSFDSFLPHGD